MKSTAIANSNIAFIKYWGKKDIKLNLPMNPSVSMTLDDNLCTKTTVEFSKKYKKDSFILNKKKYDTKRISAFLDIIRKKANTKLFAKVVSTNSFPTASGIASSASGFAALAAASTKALDLNLSNKGLSHLSRLGSGSATRSVYGSFVEWDYESGTQLFDDNYWPELRDIIIIVSDKEKPISSREAMKKTVESSLLYDIRLKNINNKVNIIKEALRKKDFFVLAQVIMQDSDEMHACINDVDIFYLNDKSHEIKNIIKEINRDGIKAAYTFDAGPNAHIISTKKYVDMIKNKLSKFGKIIVSKPGKGIKYSEDHLF